MPSLLSGRYSAVKVRKKLYVTGHAVVAVDRVAVEARRGGRRERRRVGAEQPRQLPELALREVRIFLTYLFLGAFLLPMA